MDFSSDLDNLGLPFPPDPNNQPQYDIDPSMEDPLSHALSSNNSTANSAFNSPPDLQTINSPWTSNHEPTFDQHYADLGEGRFLTQGPPYQIGPTDVITSPLNALTYHPFIPYMRPHILSHASSNSSLMSFASSYGGNLNGMPVEGLATEQTINISPNYSRHSSYSTPLMLDHTPCQTAPVPEMDIDTFPQNDHNNDLELTTPVGHPITTSALRDLPKLAVQTQGLGKAIKMRERSASRSMPYLRHRSESVSMTSEKGDDQSEMHSAATFFSAAPSPWSTLTPCSISAPLGDLTLQLKRANSDASLNSLSRSSAAPQSTRPVLSRSRRSSSLLVKSYQRESGIRLLVGEQEVEIRQQLATKAAEIDTLMETQRDKARTAWVKQWLVTSYMYPSHQTVARQSLYHSYTLSCQDYGVKPINVASFGKAVKGAFTGIRTRRLGVRGDSKYHYISLGPALSVEAQRLDEYNDYIGGHAIPEGKCVTEYTEEDSDDEDDDEDDLVSISQPVRPNTGNRDRSGSVNGQSPLRPRGMFQRRHTTAAVTRSSIHSSSLQGCPLPVFLLPGFPALEDATIYNVDDAAAAQAFWNSFCHHQDVLVSCIRESRFDQFEINLCLNPAISTMIANAIAFTYDHILIILLARLVEPLPAFGQTSLRSLADNLRTTMIQSFGIFPPDFNEGKIQLSVTAAHLFARYLDLQQLSMTLDPILSNRAQLHVMISAWDNLDTATMVSQCALSCDCDPQILEVVLSSFHEWLKEIESVSSRSGREIEKLGQWVDRTLQEVLERLPWIKIDSVARRVGFITSQVMRDFTLKSDQSFGLFQLVKTWIDDWVSIAALRRTALLPRTVGTSRSTHPSVPSMEAAMPQGIREHSTANSRF